MNRTRKDQENMNLDNFLHNQTQKYWYVSTDNFKYPYVRLSLTRIMCATCRGYGARKTDCCKEYHENHQKLVIKKSCMESSFSLFHCCSLKRASNCLSFCFIHWSIVPPLSASFWCEQNIIPHFSRKRLTRIRSLLGNISTHKKKRNYSNNPQIWENIWSQWTQLL